MNEIENKHLEEEQESLDDEINSQEVENLRCEVSVLKNQLTFTL